MESKLEVRNKKVIYMNNHRLLNDVFDDVKEFKGFLVAWNLKHLVILDSKGDLILSEEGTIRQVFNYGQYISIRKDNVIGVYRYDGKLVLPFEFYSVVICDSDEIWVCKNKGDELSLYKPQ